MSRMMSSTDGQQQKAGEGKGEFHALRLDGTAGCLVSDFQPPEL